MNKSKLGKFFGHLALIVITIGVMLFLGKHSLNFFTISFTGDDELFAWLGLLLTSGGVVVWLIIFIFLADSTIKKGVSIAMMIIAALGEFATAGFDMYMNTMNLAEGFAFAPEEIRMMSTGVAFLGLLTGLALIAYVAGDTIQEAFADEDGDGTPNAFDKDYKGKNKGKDYKQMYDQQQNYIANLKKQLEQVNVPMNANALDTVEPPKIVEKSNPTDGGTK